MTKAPFQILQGSWLQWGVVKDAPKISMAGSPMVNLWETSASDF